VPLTHTGTRPSTGLGIFVYYDDHVMFVPAVTPVREPGEADGGQPDAPIVLPGSLSRYCSSRTVQRVSSGAVVVRGVDPTWTGDSTFLVRLSAGPSFSNLRARGSSLRSSDPMLPL